MPRQITKIQPETRLLFLLAREELDAGQAEAVRTLAREVGDWTELAGNAERLFILPWVQKHLCATVPELIPAALAERMRKQTTLLVAWTLRVSAAQRALARDVLIPSNRPHVFFKGPALAARYYANPAWRFCRDIDVLLNVEDVVPVCVHAQQLGYRIQPDDRPMSERDIDAAMRYRPVVTMASPNGIIIEVHKRLDKSGAIYRTRELLQNLDSFQIGGQPMNVLAAAEHFSYICLHHTRHAWSHLHWLIDLYAMQRSEDFHRGKVLEVATRHGIQDTVLACLDLVEACSGADPVAQLEYKPHARDLLNACVANIQGTNQTEHEMREERSAPDFSFAWQTSRLHRLRARFRAVTDPLRPSFSDYADWPLPANLQWIYYFSRPFRGMRQKLERGN